MFGIVILEIISNITQLNAETSFVKADTKLDPRSLSYVAPHKSTLAFMRETLRNHVEIQQHARQVE